MKWWQEFITCLKSPDSLLHSTFTLISLGVHKLDEDSKLTRAWQYFHFCDPRRANPWTSGKLGLFCYAERQMNNQAWILLREWARATREFCVLFHTTFTKNKNWTNPPNHLKKSRMSGCRSKGLRSGMLGILLNHQIVWIVCPQKRIVCPVP